jgi:dienelactone hydrolase
MSTFEQEVKIEVDDDRIAATFVSPGTLVPGVLFVHGWGGSQTQYLARARDVAALGCVCLTFDLRGHASTQRHFETVSRAQNLHDVFAAYDCLCRRPHVDPGAIAVVGSSYGGYLAALLSKERPIQWLALRAPALYEDPGWESPKLQLHKDQDLHRYRRNRVRAQDNRALRACQDFEGDLLLIESECDAIVPRPVLTSYREAATNARSLTYRCLAGADHGLTGDSDQNAYTAVLKAWLKEMVGGVRRGAVVTPASTDKSTPPEAPPTVVRSGEV